MRIRILGPLEVLDGVEWRSIGAAKWRALLALLAVEADQVVSVDRIGMELWGDTPPKTVNSQVHGYAARLRRLLGDGAGRLLVTQSPGYRLRIAPDDTDVGRFAALVEQGRSALRGGDTDQAADRLAEALALWRGSAFQDVPATPLIQAETVRLNALRASAREDLAEVWLARGEHRAVVTELAELIVEEPLRERARELQMLALYRNGQQAEALGVYEEIRALLADQLGVDPSPSLRHRHEQILRADPALAPVESREPAPTGVVGPVYQLPPDTPDFTDRDEQLATVLETLTSRSDSGSPSIVVVAGAPGVGKSSLAVHAAYVVRMEFPDGQLYLDLAGTSATPRDPAVVLVEVLRALGVTGQWVPDGLDARASLYRSLLARRRMLLVLDDAAHVSQVRPLLPPTGSCAVVITSRRQVTDLPGARLVELDVLEPWAARQLFATIVGEGRVAAEPDQADAILRFCGYLPLAIRISGGRLAGRRAWPLRVLHDRLEDESRRLNELRVGELGVRASFDLSLRSLPAAAVQAFAMLGLLGAQAVPGWVLGPLLDRQDPDEILDLLVDANLVRLTGIDAVGQPRYRLHDLLRAYALEAAETYSLQVRTRAVARLGSVWLWLVEQAAAHLPPSIFQPPQGTSPRRPLPAGLRRRLLTNPRSWFEAERETLRGTVKIAADWGLDELTWELAANLVPYYDLASMHQDWHHTHHVALRLVHGSGNRRGEAVLRNMLAQVQIYHDAFDEAGQNLAHAHGLYREIGDRRGEALATAGLGTINRVLGNHDRALHHAEHALDLAIAAGDRHLQANLYSSVAAIHLTLGGVEAAEYLFDRALHLARQLDDIHREAVVLREMSQLYQQQGDSERALDCLEYALNIFEKQNDERCVAYTLMRMGSVDIGQRERTQFSAALTRAAALFERDGDRLNEATCWRLLGEFNTTHGDLASARVHLIRSLRLWQAFDAHDKVTEISTKLADLEE
jgi:DNA-binding SARP family transcriptional activator